MLLHHLLPADCLWLSSEGHWKERLDVLQCYIIPYRHSISIEIILFHMVNSSHHILLLTSQK